MYRRKDTKMKIGEVDSLGGYLVIFTIKDKWLYINSIFYIEDTIFPMFLAISYIYKIRFSERGKCLYDVCKGT